MRSSIVTVALGFGIALLGGAASGEGADKFPSKPFHIISSSTAGSSIDVFARVVAKEMQRQLAQSVVVENRIGGSGSVALTYLLSQPADGYTLYAATRSMIGLFALKRGNFMVDSFDYVSLLAVEPPVLAIPPGRPYRTGTEFIEYARKNPGQVKVAGTFVSGFHFLVWKQIDKDAGMTTRWIPFEGGIDAVVSAAGGHADAVFNNASTVRPQVDAGKLIPVLVSADARVPMYPDVPTFTEVGVPVVEYQWRGFVARKGTPPEVLKALEAAFAEVRKDPEYLAFLKKGNYLDQFTGSAEFTRMAQRQTRTATDIARELNLR